jgi:hypothetical protein
LFDILNNHTDESELRNICLLYAEFIRRNLFSVEQYMKSLISLGLEKSPIHLYFVKHFPFTSTALSNQRNIILYGPSYGIRLRKEPLLAESINDYGIDHIDGVTMLSIHAQFKLTAKLVTQFKSQPTEEHFLSVLSTLITLQDYWSIYTIISIGLDIPVLESIAIQTAVQFMDLIVALDYGQHMVRVLLRKHKTEKNRVIEDLLRVFNSHYIDAFKMETNLRKEFPQLTVFMDAFLLGSPKAITVTESSNVFMTPPSPSSNNFDLVLEKVMSSHNMIQTLVEYASNRNGITSHLFAKRDLISMMNIGIDKYPIDKFASMLREMYHLGTYFTSGDLLEAFSYVVQDRVVQAPSMSAIKIVLEFVITCVVRGVFSYEDVVLHTVATVILAIKSRSKPFHYWFIRMITSQHDDQLVLPQQTMILWNSHKRYAGHHAISNVIKILTSMYILLVLIQ